jgi:hypothetical protein
MSGTCSRHGRHENALEILVENLKGRDPWENLRIDRRIVLKQIKRNKM